MADSVSTEAWLDQRRWAALEEALKAQGSNVKRHLQDYLITVSYTHLTLPTSDLV